MRAPTSTEDLTHTDAVVSPHLLKRVMKYSLNTTLYGFGAIGLGTGIDGIIISRYFGVAEVGIYAFAFSLIIAIHGLNPLILLKGLFINLVTRNFVKTGCRQELANSGQLAVRAGFFVGFPLFSYVCLLGAPIINLVYSPALLPATTLLPIFSIMALVRCSTLVNFAVASTLELSRYLSLINLIGVINVVLALLLAPRFGIVGVAAATCASELVWTFYLGWVVLRIGNVPLKFIDKSFFVVCFNMLVGAVPILVERSNISSISGLLALGAVSFCLYALASYLHSPFSSAEWSAMISVVKKRK
jgi:O-antigen/teichoic acid export membrane protein